MFFKRVYSNGIFVLPTEINSGRGLFSRNSETHSIELNTVILKYIPK